MVLTAASMGTVSPETDFAPLRDRLMTLRRQMLITLAEQPEDGSLDAGLLALAANAQTVLAAVDVMIAERPRPRPVSRP